eukprot:5405629-Alexandrium_andersonii.AAC.1
MRCPPSPRTWLRASSPGRRQPAHLGTSDAAFEGPARAGRALGASRPRAAYSSSDGSLSPRRG